MNRIRPHGLAALAALSVPVVILLVTDCVDTGNLFRVNYNVRPAR